MLQHLGCICKFIFFHNPKYFSELNCKMDVRSLSDRNLNISLSPFPSFGAASPVVVIRFQLEITRLLSIAPRTFFKSCLQTLHGTHCRCTSVVILSTYPGRVHPSAGGIPYVRLWVDAHFGKRILLRTIKGAHAVLKGGERALGYPVVKWKTSVKVRKIAGKFPAV